jgi:hypothetical protein
MTCLHHTKPCEVRKGGEYLVEGAMQAIWDCVSAEHPAFGEWFEKVFYDYVKCCEDNVRDSDQFMADASRVFRVVNFDKNSEVGLADIQFKVVMFDASTEEWSEENPALCTCEISDRDDLELEADEWSPLCEKVPLKLVEEHLMFLPVNKDATHILHRPI